MKVGEGDDGIGVSQTIDVRSTAWQAIPNPKPKISRRLAKEKSDKNVSVLTSNSTQR